jgi:hypothetical protein
MAAGKVGSKPGERSYYLPSISTLSSPQDKEDLIDVVAVEASRGVAGGGLDAMDRATFGSRGGSNKF